jgi:ABC-type nitrate/sulfonate/bicarbonate transport system ATPase subunit
MRTDDVFLTVEGLAKTYPGASEPVFDSVNFGMHEGEFVCIIGHSGCGKTTILNVLAGLEQASEGHVFMDRREVAGPGLERGVVFQGHALMPWLTVRKNIAFAVRSKWPDWPADRVDAHVEKYVAMVGLQGRHRQEAQRAEWRHEAAGGHCPRLRHPAAHAAAGRALRRAGRTDPRHHPGRAAAHLRRDPADGVHDHPRRG